MHAWMDRLQPCKACTIVFNGIKNFKNAGTYLYKAGKAAAIKKQKDEPSVATMTPNV